MCKCTVMCGASLAVPLECREEWLNCTMNPLKGRYDIISTGVIMTPLFHQEDVFYWWGRG